MTETDAIPKAELRRAIQELYYWKNRDSSSFTAVLYALISKADRPNWERLSDAFPNECEAFVRWQAADDENEFFRQWLGDRTMRRRIR